MYPESVMEANFDCEAIVGADVDVYTKEKANMPWAGRVLKLLPDLPVTSFQYSGIRGEEVVLTHFRQW